MAVFVKACRSCRTNSTIVGLQPLFLACCSLTLYSKRVGLCTFNNNGCVNYFLWTVKCFFKCADFDVSEPDIH